MKHAGLMLWLLAGVVLGSRPSAAQYTADFQTNIISGLTSNWSGFYSVGYTNANDVLIIQKGGVFNGDMWGGSAGLAATYNSSNNFVLVSGPGSLWNFAYGYIILGGESDCCSAGPGNRMVITNGGVVVSYHGYIGGYVFNAPGNDSVLVSDPGSAWKMGGQFVVGDGSSQNSLVISNGAVVYNYDGYMGYSGYSGFNSALVTGIGSVWSNAAGLEIGPYGGPNTLSILNGALVTANYGSIGPRTSSNLVVVSGSGSLWSNRNDVTVGGFGSGNTLVISNGGSLVASNLCIGTVGAGTYGENPVEGPVGEGTLILNGGSITVGRFLATNDSSFVTFNSGFVSAWQTTVSNGPVFVVGDGIQAATFHMLGGTNSFASNLWIRANALLTGCATVYGSTLVDGMLVADCGDAFTFAGTVTNTGTIVVQNNTALSFYGPVVNNGLIVATNGMLQGYSTLQNNGTILGVFQDMHDVWTNSSGGKWEEASNWSQGAPTNSLWCVVTNPASKTVTIDASTATLHPETLAIDSLTLGGANGTNLLSLSNPGIGTPFKVQRTVTVGTGAKLTINNAAMQIGAFSGSSLKVDGEVSMAAAILTATNGLTSVGANSAGSMTVSNSTVTSSDVCIGRVPGSSGVLTITGTGSMWSNQSTVYIGQDATRNQLVIANGGHLVDGYGDEGHSSASSNNSVTVIGTGSVWSNLNDLSVGVSGASNGLVIRAGGAAYSSNGYIGSNATAIGNSVLVTDVGSVWSNRFNLVIGGSGAGNSLVLSNGGRVFSAYLKSGSNSVGYASNGNRVLVSGTGSVWAANNPINIGYSGIGNSLVISNGGQVTDNSGAVGVNPGSTNNSVLVTGTGSAWSNSSRLFIGYSGAGNSMAIRNGGLVTGGLDQFASTLGYNSSSSNNTVLVTDTGSVWNNRSSLYVGYSGAANNMTINGNGQVINLTAYLGYNSGSSNNSVLVTGFSSVWSNRSTIFVGFSGAGNNLVISNGGQVINKGVPLSGGNAVGYNSSSSNNSVRVVDGAVWQNSLLRVGEQGSSNSLFVAGGSVFATSLTIGFASSTCDNLIQLDSGSVIVTNATADAVFEVRQGKYVQNGGLLQVDRFVMTNVCAQFVRTGGTLIYGVAVLDPTRDDDGDGMPNGWEQSYGLDPLNSADANADADGDGVSNLQEFLAGTDPTNSASAFRIVEIAALDEDLLLTWTTVGGKKYAVQILDAADGGYTNDFVEPWPVIIAPGSGESMLSVIHPGGATVPGRFYRVRLVP